MSYKPRPYRRTAVPNAATLHGLRRFTSGYTPALRKEVAAAGGFGPWFNRQLADGYDDAWYSATAQWWSSIDASPETTVQRARDEVEGWWRIDANYQCWAMVRRVGSKRQVREVMAEFWEDHLNVPANGGVGPYRASYGKTVRSHALGRFDEMLQAAITHPAMAIYLNNANSSRSAPNENLGREVLELHTVGRGNYDEDDVKSSARILTGYRVGLWGDWAFSYDPTKHWTGPVKVMGFEHANGNPDGRAVLSAYLKYLAHHPATARRIAFKLARRFVSDNPPDALVTNLANVYLANGTAIGPVLKALVASAAFQTSRGEKVRVPTEDVVATWRALGTRFAAGPANSSDESGANALIWLAQAIGLAPFTWPRPDGRPDEGSKWSSTSRFLASLKVHYAMAGGWWPTVRTIHRKPATWLPQRRIRFDHLVDHLARTMYGSGSTAVLLQAACEATGCRPATVITPRHALVRWSMPRLLTVFLDSPTHMTR